MKIDKILNVSVGTSAFNEEGNIKNMLQTVIRQKESTFRIKEIIVISDGSSDRTVRIAQSVKDKRIKVINDKKRLGLSARINQLLRIFKGDVLVILDSDMVLRNKTTLEKMVSKFRIDKSTALVCGEILPLPGQTFLERAVNNYKYTRSCLEQRNIYNFGKTAYCAHAFVAYSKKFAKSLTIPKNIINWDAFSYFSCITKGHKQYYEKDAIALYRSPQTAKDHVSQSTRHFAGGLQLKKYFGDLTVEKGFSIPITVQLMVMSGQLIRNPLAYIYLKIINTYCRHRSKKIFETFNMKWEPIVSSKQLSSQGKKETKKFINILIPNAPGPSNIGDVAILNSLVSILKDTFKNVKFDFHYSESQKKNRKITNPKHTLYHWAIYERRNPFAWIINTTHLIFLYIVLKFNLPLTRIINPQIRGIVDDYKKADLIVFVGGGYVRSKKGVKQALNLFMMLYTGFLLAEITNPNAVVAPISFGPFAYKWQQKIAASILNNMRKVLVREEYSYRQMKSLGMKNVILSPDLALYTKKVHKFLKRRPKLILGFTVRQWFETKRQKEFELILTTAIKKFTEATDAVVQPIVQVDAPLHSEDDARVTRIIQNQLKRLNVPVLEIKNNHKLLETLEAYSNVDLLLGMRMHSNILAATQGTPFVAISYEYKTEGIVKYLGMEEFIIKSDEVDHEKLYNLLMKAFHQRRALKKRIRKSLEDIQKKDLEKLKIFLFSNYE